VRPAAAAALALAGLRLAAPASVAAQPAPPPRPAAGPVTLAVVNARVWTGAPRRPWADAVVVRGERLALVGGSAEARKLAAGSPGARVVDARGQMLVPGFTDAHVHFVDGGFRLASVQLRDAATPEEFVRRIGAFAATVPAGTWIRGGDWDHERWGGRLPTRAWIDAVTPDHPVWVNRLDGHMALANSRALALAGVRAARPTRAAAPWSATRPASPPASSRTTPWPTSTAPCRRPTRASSTAPSTRPLRTSRGRV
jgi:predicted amidohydrolase YtcJ